VSEPADIMDESSCDPGTRLYGRIAEFLYREADLLDSHRYADWFALFAPDIRYDMPVRINEFRARGDGFRDIAFFDENYASLRTRVKRLETDSAWAESPPSRTRHFVSNILASPGPQAGEFAVQSSFMITRTRSDQGYQLFTGKREDVLRSEGEHFKIARRHILVDQTVITNTNLSILF